MCPPQKMFVAGIAYFTGVTWIPFIKEPHLAGMCLLPIPIFPSLNEGVSLDEQHQSYDQKR